MGKRQRDIPERLIKAGILTCACLAPINHASALVFGELGLHSYLGQPLVASVPIVVRQGEQVDTACLSLGRQPIQSDTQLPYLTQAVLALEQVGSSITLKITTSRALNEPYIKLLLQSNCGQENYVREFTALLDPVETAVVAPESTSSTQPPSPRQEKSNQPSGLAWEALQGETLKTIAAGFYPRQPRMQRKMVQAMRDANPDLRDVAAESPLPDGAVLRIPNLKSISPSVENATILPGKPHKASAAVLHTAARIEKAPDHPARGNAPAVPAASEAEFRLKLSSSDLDLSLLGKMTEEQRQHLREKQLLLDADDQVANSLSMKNRIKQLESQINELQSALGNTNNRLAISERMAASPVRKAEEPAPGINWFGWLENFSIWVMAGVTLIGTLMASLWWRWRRRQVEAQLDSGMEHEFPPEIVSHYTPYTPVSQPETAAVTLAQDGKTDEEDLFHPTSIYDTHAETVTFAEAESVLDEVDLYLAYGWANRAIDLLQGYLESHPDDTQLWKKLLETYSAQGMKQEFERSALRCQAIMEGSGLWKGVQKLGRQMDPNNPLYRGGAEEQEEVPAAPAEEAQPRQPETPTLDTPLEFVLEPVKADQPASANEVETLDLDPLFPELVENIKKESEDGKNEGKAK